MNKNQRNISFVMITNIKYENLNSKYFIFNSMHLSIL